MQRKRDICIIQFGSSTAAFYFFFPKVNMFVCLFFYFLVTDLKIEFHNCNVLTQLISGAERNFHKYPRSTIDSLGTRYDYGSLMHYSSTAFSKNGRATIVPKRSGVCFHGNLTKCCEHLNQIK